MAALLYAPIFIFFGYFFNYNLEIVMNKIISARHIVFILFIALIGLAAAFFINKKFFRVGFRK